MFTKLSPTDSRKYKHLFKKLQDVKHQYLYNTTVRRTLQCACAALIILMVWIIITNTNFKGKHETEIVNITTKNELKFGKNDTQNATNNELGINPQNLSQVNILQFIKNWGKESITEEDNAKQLKNKTRRKNIWSNRNISNRAPFAFSKSVLNNIEISNIVYDFGACGCTGWGIETVNIINALYANDVCKNIKLITDYDCWCDGYSKKTVDLMNRFQSSDDLVDLEDIQVFISHKPPSRYPTFPYYGLVTINNRPQIMIGRSMLETEGYISPSDIERLKWMDEIWVPSLFVKIIYIRNGLYPNKIRVIPPSINTDIYSSSVKPYKIKYTQKAFRFLSVFKWEPRKGYKVLLKAFISEFKKKDNVLLYLQTYAYEQNEDLSRDFEYLQSKLNETIASIIDGETGLSEKREYIMQYIYPKIQLMTKKRTMKQLASLYKTCDCFVLSSHGEGFGMPVVEAMSVGTPVIVTKYSGLRDIVLNSSYGYLIDIEGKESAQNTVGRYDFDEEKQKWAKVNVTSLMLHMRYVFKHKKKAKKIGKNGQRFVLNNFHPDVVAEKINTRIKQLVYLKNNNQSS